MEDNVENKNTALIDQKQNKILQDWYKKRKWFIIIATFNQCLYLFEFSALSLSALYYFTFTMKVENPKLYFSLTIGAMYVLCPFSSLFAGRYVDRTRNLRKITLLFSILNLLGNLMYVFPLLNWFPILGRFICGIPSGIRPAFTGEQLPNFVLFFHFFENLRVSYCLLFFVVKQTEFCVLNFRQMIPPFWRKVFVLDLL